MATARNLCQHLDDGRNQCTSNDYILCPHCNLQLCLKHLNRHQELLRSELYTVCDDIDRIHMELNNLIFDSTNRREYLFKQLDDWYEDKIDLINKLYAEKRQQIQILCLQSHMEFDTYKSRKEKQLRDNIIKQLSKVLKQKEIHVDDLNEIRSKLNYIQRGLDELTQLNIDIHFNDVNLDVNIVKQRYIEAAKPLFHDDDNNQWEAENYEEDEDGDQEEKPKSSNDHQVLEDASNIKSKSSASSITLLPSLAIPSHSSSIIIMKKPQLNCTVKRLQHPTISTEIKYKLRTVNSSLRILT